MEETSEVTVEEMNEVKVEEPNEIKVKKQVRSQRKNKVKGKGTIDVIVKEVKEKKSGKKTNETKVEQTSEVTVEKRSGVTMEERSEVIVEERSEVTVEERSEVTSKETVSLTAEKYIRGQVGRKRSYWINKRGQSERDETCGYPKMTLLIDRPVCKDIYLYLFPNLLFGGNSFHIRHHTRFTTFSFLFSFHNPPCLLALSA